MESLVQMLYFSHSVCDNCTVLCSTYMNASPQLYWKYWTSSCTSCSLRPIKLISTSCFYSGTTLQQVQCIKFSRYKIALVWWTQFLISRITFMCFGMSVVCIDVCVCLRLINCFYLCADWIHEPASVCSCLCCLWATCLLPRLLLRSRDKAHWCLSAPWQITEADRYKDSGRQL